MRYRVLFVAVLVAIAGVGVGAAPATAADHDAVYEECEFPVTVEDATGEEITLEEPPERITTVTPNMAQTMWEIGGKDQVVGLTQFAFYLEGAENRTDVTGDFGASTELVVGTEPDLVLAGNETPRDDVEELRELGLTVYKGPETNGLDAIADQTTAVGQLTGNCEGAAEANAWVEANVDALRTLTAGVEDRPRVLIPIGGGFVFGEASYAHDMVVAAGGNHVVTEADGFESVVSAEMSDETVVDLDPEVLVVTFPGVVDQEPYSLTAAGENGSEVVIRQEWLFQAAPRSVVFATHNMTAGFHPDLYDEDAFVPREEIEVVPESELRDPSFEVSDVTLSSSTVTAGDTVASVSATVENAGDVAGEQTVRLSVAGEQVAERQLSLDAGAEASVEFQGVATDDLDPGEVTVTVASENSSASATLTVEGAGGSDGTDDTAPADGTDDETVPGFGAVAAVVALATAGLLARRAGR